MVEAAAVKWSISDEHRPQTQAAQTDDWSNVLGKSLICTSDICVFSVLVLLSDVTRKEKTI